MQGEIMQAEKTQNIGYELFNKLLKAFNQSAEEVLSLFNDDVVIEYPYAASLGAPIRLNKQEYSAHLEFILPQMPGITFSEIRIYPLSETDSYWAETHGEAIMRETAKKYEQDYVMYFTIRDGKFGFYREYWNPQAFLQASDGLENTK